jgi:Spy/CpxP family protein refolding chaperone
MTNGGKRTALILTPILVVGLLGGLAWSQRSGGPGGPGGERARMVQGERRGHHGDHGVQHRRGGKGRFMKRMVEKLELNDKQTKEIKSVIIEARKKNIKLRADARVARIELGQLITQGNVDKTAVNAKVDQIASLRGDVMHQRAGAALSVREILTPEQQVKADGMLRRLLQGRSGRRGR